MLDHTEKAGVEAEVVDAMPTSRRVPSHTLDDDLSGDEWLVAGSDDPRAQHQRTYDAGRPRRDHGGRRQPSRGRSREHPLEGGPDANGNRPTDVVRNFLAASTTADCETPAESMAGWGEEELATCRSTRKPTPNPAKVLSVELEGFYTDPDPALPDLEPGTAVVIATMDWNRGPGRMALLAAPRGRHVADLRRGDVTGTTARGGAAMRNAGITSSKGDVERYRQADHKIGRVGGPPVYPPFEVG